MFWDADLWMVPPLALLSAPAAGAVMGFRGRTGQSIWLSVQNAGLYGFDGAHYPWETAPSDGHDAAVAPTDWSEQVFHTKFHGICTTKTHGFILNSWNFYWQHCISY